MKSKLLLATLLITTLFSFAQANNKAEETTKSKELVTAFFKMAFTDRQPVKAAKMYISENKYIQHNPHGADGRTAFINGYAQYVLETNYQAVIKRVIAEGDLVMVHSHGKLNPKDVNERGEAVVDIFRVENGKIVQHWDVIQQIPEKSQNNNTMF